MLSEERRNATRARIASGQLPPPRWVTVHPGSGATGRCDGCGETIQDKDYSFSVLLQESLRFQFHDECFDVYNQSQHPR
jgi:hypothetical protein